MAMLSTAPWIWAALAWMRAAWPGPPTSSANARLELSAVVLRHGVGRIHTGGQQPVHRGIGSG